MIFKRTVTKREKKKASKRRLGIILIFIGLLALNFSLVYMAFFEKPKPIVSPLSKNQISSNATVEKKLKERNIVYTSFTTEKDLNYKIKLESGGEVIIDSGKNIDQQLSSLQLILKQLKIEGKALKRLDFRYQKPIITL
jgi:cell division septal protein FtsQ